MLFASGRKPHDQIVKHPSANRGWKMIYGAEKRTAPEGAVPVRSSLHLQAAGLLRAGSPFLHRVGDHKSLLPAVVVTDAPLAVWGKRQSKETLPLWDQHPPRRTLPSISILGAVPQERPILTSWALTPASLRFRYSPRCSGVTGSFPSFVRMAPGACETAEALPEQPKDSTRTRAKKQAAAILADVGQSLTSLSP